MQCVQASKQLDQEAPQLILSKLGALARMLLNFGEHVAIFCKLHHQTDGLGPNVYKRLLVRDHVFVSENENSFCWDLLDGSNETDFVEGVFLFFLTDASEFDLHKRVIVKLTGKQKNVSNSFSSVLITQKTAPPTIKEVTLPFSERTAGHQRSF